MEWPASVLPLSSREAEATTARGGEIPTQQCDAEVEGQQRRQKLLLRVQLRRARTAAAATTSSSAGASCFSLFVFCSMLIGPTTTATQEGREVKRQCQGVPALRFLLEEGARVQCWVPDVQRAEMMPRSSGAWGGYPLSRREEQSAAPGEGREQLSRLDPSEHEKPERSRADCRVRVNVSFLCFVCDLHCKSCQSFRFPIVRPFLAVGTASFCLAGKCNAFRLFTIL